MASSKEYLDFILSKVESLGDVSSRKMMGEYIVYYHDKIIGGIYDNRFLVKPVPSVIKNVTGEMAEPYSGAKQMFLIKNVENPELLCSVIQMVYNDLYKM